MPPPGEAAPGGGAQHGRRRHRAGRDRPQLVGVRNPWINYAPLLVGSSGITFGCCRASLALIALGCWWSGTGKLSKLYDTNQKTIKAEFTNLKSVKMQPFHPERSDQRAASHGDEKQTDGVTKLWEQLYDRQREDVLKWPLSLSKAFRDAVEKMQFGDEIDSELRNNYQNYIEQHFPELPKQIGAREMLPNETGGVGGGRPRPHEFSPEGRRSAE